MFHKAKGDEVRSRIVAREYADGVFAAEHHAGPPPTWALKLVIGRLMSKGRTRQLASHDVSVAFFHAWLESEASERSQIERSLAVVCGESALQNERIEQGVPRGGA